MLQRLALATFISAALAAPAAAAGPELGPPLRIITPVVIALRHGEMPGFKLIRGETSYATSAASWTKELEELGAAGQDETRHLTEDTFQDGVMEFLEGPHHSEAVYNAMVFLSDSGARSEAAEDVAYDLAHYPRNELHRSSLRGIPGSVAFAGFLRTRHEASANVIFSLGTCSFIVADSLHGATDAAQGLQAPVRAARALYRRLLRSPCAA